MKLTHAVLLSFATLACGRVQFVSPETPAAPPPTQPQEDLSVQETLTFDQVTASQILLFELYPRKSMEPAKAELLKQTNAFFQSYFPANPKMASLTLELNRDVLSAPTDPLFLFENVFARKSWPARSIRFLGDGLRSMQLEPGAEDVVSDHPFTNFAAQLVQIEGTLSNSSIDASVTARPNIHLVYFRDRDLRPDLEDASIANAEQDLSRALDLKPFSRFKVSLHAFYYLNAQSSCQPTSSSLARRIRAVPATFAYYEYELCDFLQGASVTQLHKLANDISFESKRWVLSYPPKPESLKIKIHGVEVARKDVFLDSLKNELSVSAAVLDTLSAGDSIEVNYERAK